MSKQETNKIMNTKTNCEDSNQTDALADLLVAEGQAEEAKGGVAIKTYICPSDSLRS